MTGLHIDFFLARISEVGSPIEMGNRQGENGTQHNQVQVFLQNQESDGPYAEAEETYSTCVAPACPLLPANSGKPAPTVFAENVIDPQYFAFAHQGSCEDCPLQCNNKTSLKQIGLLVSSCNLCSQRVTDQFHVQPQDLIANQ